MKHSYIVESVRTAVGKMGGTLKDVPVNDLCETVIREVLNRSNKTNLKIDEVIIGQAKQSADTSNLARLATLQAGLSVNIPGYTVHRQCGSGLQAINNADMQIKLGLSDVVIAGGAESMSTAPYYIRNARYGLHAGNGLLLDPNTESQSSSQPSKEYGNLTMGLTAENLADKYEISRLEQDEFARRSQELAYNAIKEGVFSKEIVPFKINKRKKTTFFKEDEHPRLSTIDVLGKLPAVFKKNGSVTAGNSSGRNDGAAVVLMMNKEKLNEYGLIPRAKIIAQASSGVSPEIMGIGPVESTKKALKQCNLSIEDIDLIELNEAFSAQALSVIKETKMDIEKVNVNGGAIALGHPIGATGAILMTKLLHEMERRGDKYGLVTLCIGGGQGITTIVENLV